MFFFKGTLFERKGECVLFPEFGFHVTFTLFAHRKRFLNDD